jgi:hypothetical protein
MSDPIVSLSRCVETFSSSRCLNFRSFNWLKTHATKHCAQQLQFVDGFVHVATPVLGLAILVLTMQHCAAALVLAVDVGE